MRREREAAIRDANDHDNGNGGYPPPGSGVPFGESDPSGRKGGGGNEGGGAVGYGSNPPALFYSSSHGGATNPQEPLPPADAFEPLNDEKGELSSGENLNCETDPNNHSNNDGRITDETSDSKNQKGNDITEDSDNYLDPSGKRLTSVIDDATLTAPLAATGGGITATTNAATTDIDDDTEMIELSDTDGIVASIVDLNTTVLADYNMEEMMKKMQAAQDAWELQYEIPIFPPGFEAVQDSKTSDGWHNAYDNANGDHALPAVPTSSTTRFPPDHSSVTYNPFSNANYRGEYGHTQPTGQVDFTSLEELARIETAENDKDMQRDTRKDLGLPLGGHTQLLDSENQGDHKSYGAADWHNDFTAGFLGINFNDNHAYDYGQAHGIDKDFVTSPDHATGVNQVTTSTTGGEVVDGYWTYIRPKTRLVQLWEDGQIVDNPDYPEHRSTGMNSLQETFGEQCHIFREVDMVAYDKFGEDHENFKYAQDAVYWFNSEAEGAKFRDSFDHEVGQESSDESDLSDPPSSDDLNETGANLLIQEMDDKIQVLKNEGRDVIDHSELASEDADLGNKGEESGASFCDNEVATSYPMITDGTREELEMVIDS
jgi:hypothetical protein